MDDRKRLVAAGYDDVAARYAELERPGHEWPRMRLLRELLARLEPGCAVVDLGCGNGVPSLREIAARHEAVGVDISRTQIAAARMNVPDARLVHADAAEIDFPPGSFAAAVSFYTLDHLPREEHAPLLARVRSWLDDGGWLLFSVEPDDEPGIVGDWLGRPMYFSHFDAETTLAAVRQAGFDVVRSHIETQLEGEREVPFLWVLARARMLSG